MTFESIESWFLYFVLYSVLGWVYETTLCSVRARKFINRGFLIGPVCPIYGTGGVAVTLLFQSLKGNIPLLFLSSAVLCCVIEYLTSYAMEKLFHARWWDYSKRPLNIHGRVCLLGFVAFGAMSVLVVEFAHPFVTNFVASWATPLRHVCAALFLALFIIDLSLTLPSVLKLPSHLTDLRALVEQKIESLPPIKRLNSFQWKRLSFAFPSLHFPNLTDEWEKLRTDLKKKLHQ